MSTILNSPSSQSSSKTPVLPTFVCMKWGTRYGPVFVNRLFKAVKRNMDKPFRFICFTDDNTDIIDDVETHPLPPINIPDHVSITPWRKLSLWQTPLGDMVTGDIVVLDLDLVITGPLAPLFDYHPGEFCVIDNWTQPGENIGNTSVFRIPIGRYSKIFDQFNSDPHAILNQFRIEQQYISKTISKQIFWPSQWCVSFKHSLLPRFPLNWFQDTKLPQDTKIVAFTGHPDPDEAVIGKWPAKWYKKIYKHTRPVSWINEHWR